MGLDMYLNRAKRFKGCSATDINIIDAYLDWKYNKPAREDFSMEDWCGISEKRVAQIDKEAIDFYENEKHDIGYGFQSCWFEIGYWRKANAIHNWFVNNVQGGLDECQIAEVSKEQLEELLDTVNEVLDNPDLAETLLPTQSGFFFGGTEYDEWYLDELRKTKSILEDVLASTDFEKELVAYQASW